jgi:hypothetical protein
LRSINAKRYGITFWLFWLLEKGFDFFDSAIADFVDLKHWLMKRARQF